MEMYGNEIKVQQGEDFNLDILLSASQTEYIPFIISSQRNNPFFVITVASTKYEKNLRYVKSWWNDISSDSTIPRFFQTVPQDYGELDNISLLPTIYSYGSKPASVTITNVSSFLSHPNNITLKLNNKIILIYFFMLPPIIKL